MRDYCAAHDIPVLAAVPFDEAVVMAVVAALLRLIAATARNIHRHAEAIWAAAPA